MDDSLAFRIGGSNREHVVVHVTRREHPELSDYWDGNWVYATFTVAAGAFRGEFEGQLRTEEFVRFRDQRGAGGGATPRAGDAPAGASEPKLRGFRRDGLSTSEHGGASVVEPVFGQDGESRPA